MKTKSAAFWLEILVAAFLFTGCVSGAEKYKAKAEDWAVVTVKPTDPIAPACDAKNPEPVMAPGPKDDKESAEAYQDKQTWGRTERSLRKRCNEWAKGQR